MSKPSGKKNNPGTEKQILNLDLNRKTAIVDRLRTSNLESRDVEILIAALDTVEEFSKVLDQKNVSIQKMRRLFGCPSESMSKLVFGPKTKEEAEKEEAEKRKKAEEEKKKASEALKAQNENASKDESQAQSENQSKKNEKGMGILHKVNIPVPS